MPHASGERFRGQSYQGQSSRLRAISRRRLADFLKIDLELGFSFIAIAEKTPSRERYGRLLQGAQDVVAASRIGSTSAERKRKSFNSVLH